MFIDFFSEIIVLKNKNKILHASLNLFIATCNNISVYFIYNDIYVKKIIILIEIMYCDILNKYNFENINKDRKWCSGRTLRK